tara:strand:- start:298 stop:1359 length:1062 start_codon:yes stop_codon:yes gene_type:complete
MKSKLYTTTLSINKKNLIDNINFFKKKKNKIIAMIKANAYGHGDIEIAKVLEQENIHLLGVADFEEGVRLRKQNIKSRIMVTAPTENNIEEIINYNMEPCIYNFKTLKKIKKIKRQSYIHIKFNTGMNRFGFEYNDICPLFENINKNKKINLCSIFSHLADPENNDFTKKQINKFEEIKNKTKNLINNDVDYHIHNTKSYIHFQNENEIIRTGLGLYGYIENQSKMKPIAELTSKIIQIKEIKKDESVGYKNYFISKKNMKLGIIPIGYADGLKRNWSNGKLKFLIKNKLYPVVGLISMDSCIVDITNSKIKEGERVIYFGKKRNICDLAKELETIPYEITACLSKRIKRTYI